MEDVKKCKGYIEEVTYLRPDIYTNVIKSVDIKWCPLRHECYRFKHAGSRRLLNINVVGADCPYFIKIDEELEDINLNV